MHAGRSLFERLLHAGGLLREALGWPATAALLVAMAAAVRDPVERWLVALVVVPLAVAWAAGFSYELRNLALVVPLAGMAAGVGAVELAGMLGHFCRREIVGWDKQRRGPTAIRRQVMVGCRSACPTLQDFRPDAPAAGLCPLGAGGRPLLLLGMTISREDLANRQSNCNAAWAAATSTPCSTPRSARTTEPGSVVRSHRHRLLALAVGAGLERRFVACGSDKLASFQAVYQRPEIGFALVHQTHTSAEVWRYLAAAEARGSSRLLAESHYYRLYQKRADR